MFSSSFKPTPDGAVPRELKYPIAILSDAATATISVVTYPERIPLTVSFEVAVSQVTPPAPRLKFPLVAFIKSPVFSIYKPGLPEPPGIAVGDMIILFGLVPTVKDVAVTPPSIITSEVIFTSVPSKYIFLVPDPRENFPSSYQ